MPGAAIPGVLAPTIFFLGLTSVFGSLTLLPGFTTHSYQSFLIPVSLLQGAGFTGAATGVNLARDIEQGWFDRLLASPAPRPVLLAGLVLSASLRCAAPGDLPADRRLRGRRPLAGLARAADRHHPGDGDGGGRGDLGNLPRPPLPDPVRGAAHAGRDVPGRAADHGLRAAAAAHGLAADGGEDQPGDPGRRGGSPGLRRHRSAGATPGRDTWRCSGSPRCSATSRCAACAG